MLQLSDYDRAFAARRAEAEKTATGLKTLGYENEAQKFMKKFEEKERLTIVENHPYPITLGSDNRWRTYVREPGQKRRQIAKSTYDKVVDALVEFYGKNKVYHKVTLADLYPAFLEYKRGQGGASSYLKRIDNDWKSYYQSTKLITIPLQKLDWKSVEDWILFLFERVKRRRKSYYNATIIIRQILNRAMNEGVVSENLFCKVENSLNLIFTVQPKKKSETQVFSNAEVFDMRTFADKCFENERNLVQKLAPLAVKFQFETGVRISELCTLRYEDILKSQDIIRVQRFYRVHEKVVVEGTKGGRPYRDVPLSEEAYKIIAEAKKYQQDHGFDDDGYIFCINGNLAVYYAIQSVYENYGKEHDKVQRSSHKSRKTYTSLMIDKGVNINTIRDAVGHADEKTTYASYCFDRNENESHDEMRKATEDFHKLN